MDLELQSKMLSVKQGHCFDEGRNLDGGAQYYRYIDTPRPDSEHTGLRNK